MTENATWSPKHKCRRPSRAAIEPVLPGNLSKPKFLKPENQEIEK